jgi:hypothetical protein
MHLEPEYCGFRKNLFLVHGRKTEVKEKTGRVGVRGKGKGHRATGARRFQWIICEALRALEKEESSLDSVQNNAQASQKEHGG